MNWLEIIRSVFDLALLSSTLRVSVPIVLTAMGVLICERSGVLNIGAEGMMLVGALLAALGTYYSGSPWIGLLVAALAGGLMGLLHAYITVTWQGNQGISGLALYVFSVGFTGFLLQILFRHGGESPRVQTLPVVRLAFLERVPVLDKVFNHQPVLVFLALALPFILHFFFYRTQWGAWVRAAGENPKALAVAGVKPVLLRYLSIIVGGMLAGIGGAYLSISQMSLFVENMTAGRGFIALSAVIFGNWKPLGVFLAALFFSFTDALQLTLQITVPDSQIPRELFMALPYLLTLVALAGFIGRAVAPASLAQPYSEEGR